jgi:hypothetical protein
MTLLELLEESADDNESYGSKGEIVKIKKTIDVTWSLNRFFPSEYDMYSFRKGLTEYADSELYRITASSRGKEMHHVDFQYFVTKTFLPYVKKFVDVNFVEGLDVLWLAAAGDGFPYWNDMSYCNVGVKAFNMVGGVPKEKKIFKKDCTHAHKDTHKNHINFHEGKAHFFISTILSS